VIWDHVDSLISQFGRLPNISFSAGDARGRLHSYSKGSTTMQTPQILASSSKFPAALAIAGAVNKGILSFDTHAHEVFPWWTSSSADKRSAVTLRHLLTMTSGLILETPDGGDIACLNFTDPASVKTPVEDCAKEIYSRGPWKAEGPGKVWSYHSLHLQLAGAMAAKASNLTLPQLLHTHLLAPLNLTSSFWLTNFSAPGPSDDPNPHLAATLVSTGDDYEKILYAVLMYTLLPKAIIDQMEEDAYRTYPHLRPALNAKDLSLQFYGHYSMCTYFECLKLTGWDQQCYAAGVHADPGAFGYWPLVNRPKGYYMQFVVSYAEVLPAWLMLLPGIAETEAALPAQCLAPLRFAVQPWAEAALGKNVTDPKYSLPTPIALECDLAKPEKPPVPTTNLFGGTVGNGLPPTLDPSKLAELSAPRLA